MFFDGRLGRMNTASKFLMGWVCGFVLLGVSRVFAGEVGAVHAGGRVIFREGAREIGCYQAEPLSVPTGVAAVQRRGGYLHPLRTPEGHVVTGDFPADHRHHHGVWFAWTKAEWGGRATDFWNLGAGLGGVEGGEVRRVWNEGGAGCLKAGHRVVDYSSGVWDLVLEEEWEVRFGSGESGGRVFNRVDVTVGQRVAGQGALVLPSYHYGGFAFRGLDAWSGVEGMQVLASGGVSDRTGVEGGGRVWVALTGAVGEGGGARGSVVVMGHPTNFRHPEPVRMHPKDPYFCFAPQRAGGFSLEAGKPHTVSYRLMIVDGAVSAAEADGWAREWAQVDVSERRCCTSPTSRGYFFKR
ncbi:MAG: hypothetical protein RIS92_1816 [Verrucomicrobiota bacterium]